MAKPPPEYKHQWLLPPVGQVESPPVFALAPVAVKKAGRHEHGAADGVDASGNADDQLGSKSSRCSQKLKTPGAKLDQGQTSPFITSPYARSKRRL